MSQQRPDGAHSSTLSRDQPVTSADTTTDGIPRLARGSGEGLRSKPALVGLAAVAGLLVGLLLGYSAPDLPVAKQPDLPSMSQCVADTVNALERTTPTTPEILREARDHCYSFIRAQGLLSDFGYRKMNFFQQYRANGVLMWMLIVVTLSGVLLAGLQLWASYKLAAANKSSLQNGQGELSWQRDRLVLKSSVTGLFILLISFCFFLVFVFYVYRLEPSPDANDSTLRPVITSPMNGLGPPPQGNKER